MILWETKDSKIKNEAKDKIHPDFNITPSDADADVNQYTAQKRLENNILSKSTTIEVGNISNCCFLADLHLQPDNSQKVNSKGKLIYNKEINSEDEPDKLFMNHKNSISANNDVRKHLIYLASANEFNEKRVQIKVPEGCDTLIFLGDTFTAEEMIGYEYDKYLGKLEKNINLPKTKEGSKPSWFIALEKLFKKFKNIYYIQGNHDYKRSEKIKEILNAVAQEAGSKINFQDDSYHKILCILDSDSLAVLTHDPIIIFGDPKEENASLTLFYDPEKAMVEWYKRLFEQLAKKYGVKEIHFIFGHFHDVSGHSKNFDKFVKFIDDLNKIYPSSISSETVDNTIKVTAHHVSWAMLDTEAVDNGQVIYIKPLTLNNICNNEIKESYYNASSAFKYLRENFKH